MLTWKHVNVRTGKLHIIIGNEIYLNVCVLFSGEFKMLKIDDVLTEHDGLPHVLSFPVHRIILCMYVWRIWRNHSEIFELETLALVPESVRPSQIGNSHCLSHL